jgi:hypothetical protein
MLRVLWRLTRGYRLRPWRSPYLRWRIETYSGRHAERIGFGGFWRFAWSHRRELWRYLQWAGKMDRGWPSRAIGRSAPQ